MAAVQIVLRVWKAHGQQVFGHEADVQTIGQRRRARYDRVQRLAYLDQPERISHEYETTVNRGHGSDCSNKNAQIEQPQVSLTSQARKKSD